jgi:hypothetical protein
MLTSNFNIVNENFVIYEAALIADSAVARYSPDDQPDWLTPSNIVSPVKLFRGNF